MMRILVGLAVLLVIGPALARKVQVPVYGKGTALIVDASSHQPPARELTRRRGRTVLVYAAAFVLIAASAGASVVDAIDSMRSEADECGLLIALCKIASRSAVRAESTPSSAEMLGASQWLNADA